MCLPMSLQEGGHPGRLRHPGEVLPASRPGQPVPAAGQVPVQEGAGAQGARDVRPVQEVHARERPGRKNADGYPLYIMSGDS